MKAIDLINTLPKGTSVIIVNRCSEELLTQSTVKWLIKNYDNKYHTEVKHWLDRSVQKQSTDEFGRTVIMLRYGLTPKQKEAEDKKFRKEHNGKSREQVDRERAKGATLRLAAMMAMLTIGFDGPKYF